MAEAVEDALIVLPVPMNTGEASEVQWLALPCRMDTSQPQAPGKSV